MRSAIMVPIKEIVTILVGTSIVAGCVVKPDETAIGPYPENYKQIISEHIEKSFFDPYSMKSVALSGPVQGQIFFNQGWVVCLQANAKNRLGGYTGLQRSAYLINNYKIIQTMANAPMCQAEQLSFFPWDVRPDVSSTSPATATNGPSMAQKERWIQSMAQKNGCDGQLNVSIKSKAGITEVYDVTCGEETMEFTCEFDGPVSLGSGGIPFVEVTGKTYSIKPACWR